MRQEKLGTLEDGEGRIWVEAAVEQEWRWRLGELAEPLVWICAAEQLPGVMGVCISLPGDSIGRPPLSSWL